MLLKITFTRALKGPSRVMTQVLTELIRSATGVTLQNFAAHVQMDSTGLAETCAKPAVGTKQ